MQLYSIVNTPMSSLCYVVADGDSAVVIDPGSDNIDSLIAKLNGATVEFILLTHEHFDHCWGVKALREAYPTAKLVVNRAVNECIQDEKKNCSLFYDNVGFTIASADLFIEDIGTSMTWRNHIIDFLPTPGHTPGSTSIIIDKWLFSGDAYIPGIKTVTKLPGGNAAHAADSEKAIREMLSEKHLQLCPGH